MPSCGVRLFVHSVKTNKDIFKIFHHRVATPFLFFHTKRHGNTLMETPPPLTDASNAGGVGRNRDYELMSGFIACCECCDGQLLSTRLSANIWLSNVACWSWCCQLVVCPVVYHSHGASLFMAQKATHQ